MFNMRLFANNAFLVLLTSVACASTPTPTPSSPMMGGWHYRSAYGRQYFLGTDVTLEGSVIELKPVVPQPHMMRGTQVVLKTTSGLQSVHLGPHWYIVEQDLKLNPGDIIEVRGKMIGRGENAFVIAAEIKKGKKTWNLRDRDGIPHWCALRYSEDSAPPQTQTPGPTATPLEKRK